MNTYEAGEPSRLQELVCVENKYQIAKLIKTHPSAQTTGIDGTMSRWLSSVLARSQTPQQTVIAWRRLQQRGGRKFPDDFSEKQQEFLRLPESEILAFFAQALQHRGAEKPLLLQEMTERRVRKSGHGFNDKHQLKQEDKRSLEKLRTQGMRIEITPEFVELIRHHYTKEAVCPVLDAIKNEPILTINGFTQSKVALTIHDMFDHFWTFHQFEKAGLLEKYNAFLARVGNPQTTDIFKREGELIASICYEWRSSHTPERDFRPLLSFEQIQRLYRKQSSKGLTENQEAAWQALLQIDPESALARRLAQMYSGVLVELMEQRRKHGYIRLLDENFEPYDVLPLLDLEYLSLVIEGALLLCDPDIETEAYLYKINVLVEDFLVRSTQPDGELSLLVDVRTIEEFDPEASLVSEARKHWLREHFYHAATRLNACE
jgi:hypothetical protein